MTNLKILLVIAGVFFCSNSYCQESHFLRAKKYFNAGNDSLALIEFYKAIQNRENVGDSYMYLGVMAMEHSNSKLDLDSAKKKLLTAQRHGAESAANFFYLARLSRLAGDLEQAGTYLKQSLAHNSGDAYTYDERAQLRILIGQYREAIADENSAISLDTSVAIFYNNRGYAEFELMNYEKAIQDFSASLKKSKTARAFINRAACYAAIQSFDLALKDYNDAAALLPSAADIYFGRGKVLAQLGEANDACKDFRVSQKLGYRGAESYIESICGKK